MIGILGTKLDNGFGVERWDDWRPTISLFQHEDLLWDRLELLADSNFAKLTERVLGTDEQATRISTSSWRASAVRTAAKSA